MYSILIDTCVWLDIAKEPQHESLLSAIEDLIAEGTITLFLPQTILDEFSNNKAQVAEERCRSYSATLGRAREIVSRCGDPKKQTSLLEQLGELGRKIPNLGTNAVEALERIEKIFAKSRSLAIPDAIKLRAAQRAIERRAPFHRQRNGIGDAILIEMYAELVRGKSARGSRFAFITHNVKDFSHPTANNKWPHPDIASLFSRMRSLYFTNLGEALHRIDPDAAMISEIRREWVEEERSLKEMVEVAEELREKIWYNRHHNLRIQIEKGEVKLTDDKEGWRQPKTCSRQVWEGARKSAKRVEKKYGLRNLGPWDDFEWGMLNGKLSALRWVLGDEWDMLDT